MRRKVLFLDFPPGYFLLILDFPPGYFLLKGFRGFASLVRKIIIREML